MKWISSHDIRGSYKNVLERTGVIDHYSTSCQWLIGSDEFKNWYAPGVNSVVWLNGIIGTGKTTLMARAIHEMQNSINIEIDTNPLAIFFFQKATDASKNLLSVETCLQSLTRQLSWNNATAQALDFSTDKKYNDFKAKHSDDSSLTTGECVSLLKDLVSKRETYIMIDAIDECENPHKLLLQLSSLRRHTKENVDTPLPLHIMLCGRNNPRVSTFFSDCTSIATSYEKSGKDEEFFIDSEINNICDNQKGSLFCSPGKEYPTRLKDVLKRRSGGLFRWIEIQIDKFAKDSFRDPDQIDDELEWLEQHTADDELDKEYARLLQLLSENERNRERAMKMLKLIACSFDFLTVNDLAEAMTASELGTNRTELTADVVRRILVGFITETKSPDLTLRPQSHRPKGTKGDSMNIRFYLKNLDMPIIQLAHSSVLEYLTNEESNVEGFSLLSQHSEAALLGFSRIRALQNLSTLPPTLAAISRDKPSFFLIYSCYRWPDHCRRAFDQDAEGECPLLEKTREFLLGDEYKLWNDIIRHYLRRQSIAFEIPSNFADFDDVWTNGESAMPGFLIATFDLVELLEFSKIRDRIHLQDVNGNGTTLLLHLLRYSARSTISRMAELYPDEVRPSQGEITIVPAARRADVDVVRRLLDNGESIHARERNGQSALYEAVQKYSELSWFDDFDGAEALQQTIRFLLQKGAYVYEVNSSGVSPMHYAVSTSIPVLLRLFVDHATQLERNGLHGSVQRLLRMRDDMGDTPGYSAITADERYLENELRDAVERDGRVMYDFDNPDIAEIRAWRNDEATLRRYLLNRSNLVRPPQLDLDTLESAAHHYRVWLSKRRKELEAEYKAKEQEISR